MINAPPYVSREEANRHGRDRQIRESLRTLWIPAGFRIYASCIQNEAGEA